MTEGYLPLGYFRDQGKILVRRVRCGSRRVRWMGSTPVKVRSQQQADTGAGRRFQSVNTLSVTVHVASVQLLSSAFVVLEQPDTAHVGDAAVLQRNFIIHTQS